MRTRIASRSLIRDAVAFADCTLLSAVSMHLSGWGRWKKKRGMGPRSERMSPSNTHCAVVSEVLSCPFDLDLTMATLTLDIHVIAHTFTVCPQLNDTSTDTSHTYGSNRHTASCFCLVQRPECEGTGGGEREKNVQPSVAIALTKSRCSVPVRMMSISTLPCSPIAV
jgi:hypothetical protein